MTSDTRHALIRQRYRAMLREDRRRRPDVTRLRPFELPDIVMPTQDDTRLDTMAIAEPVTRDMVLDLARVYTRNRRQTMN